MELKWLRGIQPLVFSQLVVFDLTTAPSVDVDIIGALSSFVGPTTIGELIRLSYLEGSALFGLRIIDRCTERYGALNDNACPLGLIWWLFRWRALITLLR